jgi:hypothetical protein
MFKTLYEVVMSPEVNPLRTLPKIVRFQVMVILAYMWSFVFLLYIGVIAMIGPSIFAHTILLIGVFFTHDIFQRARSGRLQSVARLVLRRSYIANTSP